jgi:protein transport protein HofC
MRLHGLLTASDVALLLSATRVGNLPWAMREAAAGIERRLRYRLITLLEIAWPIVTLVFGGIVLVIVVALFWPLVTLIERLV